MTAGPPDPPAVDAAVSEEAGLRAIGRAAWRLVPFLAFLYFISYLDRVNIAFAALEMNGDLGIDKFQYGLGGGLFFIGYVSFQIPGNHLLQRFGARRWLGVIMMSWGVASLGTGFIANPTQFYVARLLLGIAEAGFFPGLVLYITYWFPARIRGRIMAGLLLSVPVASVVGAPLSSIILSAFADHRLFAAWRWLFVIEACPAILCAFIVWRVLPDGPARVSWLSPAERSWLADRLAADQADRANGPDGAGSATAQIVTFSCVYLGLGLALYGTGLWLPQIIKATGVTNGAAALMTAVPYGVAAIAMLLWGRIADLRGHRASNCYIPALVAALGLIASTRVAGLPLQLVCLSFAASGIMCALPTFWTLPTAGIPAARMGVAVAVINTTGSLGGFLGPFLMGWLSETTGSFSLGLILLAAAGAGSSLILILSGGARRAHRPLPA